METHIPQTLEALQQEWLTMKDLEKLTGMKYDTQATYRSKQKIPFYKVGRRILYRASEIHAWLTSHKAV